MGQGGQEGEGEIGGVLAGVRGLHMRYVYTGKRSERSPYIAERAQSMHNLTRNEMLQRSYKDRRGVCVPYQERDLRYDVAHGYLRQEGGDQASKGGVMHRGVVVPAQASKERGFYYSLNQIRPRPVLSLHGHRQAVTTKAGGHSEFTAHSITAHLLLVVLPRSATLSTI